MQGCSPSHSRPHRFGSKSRHLRSRLRVNEGRFGSGARRACTHKRSRTRRGRARARESPAARVDASTSTRRAATGDASRELRCRTSPPRTRVAEIPAWRRRLLVLGGGGASPEAGAHAHGRKLDMLASDAASAREDDAGTRRSRTPSSSVPLELGRTFHEPKRPGVVATSASACGVCCSERGARGGRGVSSVRDGVRRARDRGHDQPVRGVRGGRSPFLRVGDQEKFLAEREASRDKNADDVPARLRLVSQQKTSISWDVGASPAPATRAET